MPDPVKMKPRPVKGQKPNGEWCYSHDWQEFIDPRSGGFVRCSKCELERDCEDPDGDCGNG